MWLILFLILSFNVQAQEFEKVGTTELKKTIEVSEVYDIEMLKKSKVAIEKQLNEVNALLNKAQELGVQEKTIEVVSE